MGEIFDQRPSSSSVADGGSHFRPPSFPPHTLLSISLDLFSILFLFYPRGAGPLYAGGAYAVRGVAL